MSKTIIHLIAGLWILAAASANGATIRVPADYADMQAAINASVNGDTVLVAPGRYAVNLHFFAKNILLTSEAGPELTFLDALSISLPIIKITNGETFEAAVDGFTFGVRNYNSEAIYIANCSPTILNNIFRKHVSLDASTPALMVNGASNSYIARNLFYGNSGPAMNVWIEMAGAVQFVNNTIYGGAEGIMAASSTTRVRNNIITGCGIGLYSPSGWFVIEDYNDVWGNMTNYSAISPSPTDISSNPVFLDTLAGNFRLHRASPGIDAGNLSGIYNDPDGTRNDMGAYPFDQRIPSAFNLNLGSEVIAHVLNHTPVFHWLFYDTVYLTQAGYEIEVGTDKDWTTAEMWQSGKILTADNFATYAGTSLQDGATYYYRIRVSGNGTNWGEWKEAAFTMNAAPSAPELNWPIDQAVSIDGIRLIVNNSFDANGDALYYDFAIYSDPGLTQMVILESGVREQTERTKSRFYDMHNVGAQYWWRARAGDNYVTGNWSAPATFTLRNPMAVRVLSDYPTIQAGIEAAQEGDTVLVAAGIYTGDGNRDLTFKGKHIVLKSEEGPEVTIIDCQAGPMNAHWGIYMHDSEDTTAVVEGFTIRNSFTDELGAIYLVGASPTIRNCIVTQNEGMGILAVNMAKPIIDHCIVSNNSLNGINEGYYRNGGAIISNTLIKGNGQHGVWTSIWPGTSVTNCTIVGNGWAGIHFEEEPPKMMQPSLDSTIISNCIIAYNQYGILKWGWFPAYSIRCNNSFGNDSGNYLYLAEHGGDSLGNLELNPLFCNYPAGDYRISSNSPCAPGNNSCAALMGAFEVNCTLMCGDIDGNGAVNLLDIMYLIRHLYKGGPPPTVPNIADVDHSGSINLLDVTYMINFLYKQGAPLNCP